MRKLEAIVCFVSLVMLTGYVHLYAMSRCLEPLPGTPDFQSLITVKVAPDGVKWFQEYRHHVYSFDERHWEVYEVEPVGFIMTDMAIDDAGIVYVCKCDVGVCYLLDGSFHQVPELRLSRPSSLAYAADGSLWAGGAYQFGMYGYAVRYVFPEGWPYVTFGGEVTWLDECWNPEPAPDDAAMAFAFAPDGRVWFASCRGLAVRVNREYDGTDTFLSGGNCQNDIGVMPWGEMWITSDTVYHYQPDILRSVDGEKWSPFDHPHIEGKTGSALCVTVEGDRGLWFSSGAPDREEPRLGGGAFWYDHSDWRWIDFGQNVPVDIAVDPATSDVWFITGDAVYVMRGGPEAWPPVWIELEVGVDEAGGAEAFSLLGSAEFQMDLNLDLYVAVQLPGGDLLFAPDWSPTISPLVPGLEVPIGLNIEDMPLVTVDTAGMPAGTYRWFAACTHAGTSDFASNIASCEWQFE